MSKSNWRGHIALVGIAGCLLATSWLWLEHSNSPWRAEHRTTPTKQAYERHRQYQQTAQDATAWINRVKQHEKSEEANAHSGGTLEQEKDYHDALDLGAQWHAAEAAASMVNWTIAHFFIGLFGLFGLGVTVWLTRQTAKAAIEASNAAKEQSEIIRKEFLATHRPRIRIKHVWLKSEIWEGTPVKVQIIVVNSGESDALIDSFKVTTKIVKIDSTLPGRPEFSEGAFKVSDLRIASGITLELPEIETLKPSAEENPGIRNRIYKLYCYGVVQYWDGSKTHYRTTAFCRELVLPPYQKSHLDTGRFAPLTVPDSDYEYED